MSLNLTAFQGVDSFFGAGNLAMSLTNNMFFIVIIIMIYIVALWKLTPRYDLPSAVATASFVGLALSAPLAYLQWVNIFFPIFFIFATAGSLFIIKISN